MARILFFVLGALHLLTLAVGIPIAEFATKALLMPVLAWWLHREGGPRLMVAGLLLSAGGDIALEFDGLFILGMGFFAAAHVCYVTFFARFWKTDTRRQWTVAGVYGVVWVVLVVFLWPGLGTLQIPVTAYSLLLTATAVTSVSSGARTGVGGAFFLVSDSLIAFGLADVEIPMRGELVMLTYIAAQYLLASGSLSRADERIPAGA